jgi:hypothetical protein
VITTLQANLEVLCSAAGRAFARSGHLIGPRTTLTSGKYLAFDDASKLRQEFRSPGTGWDVLVPALRLLIFAGRVTAMFAASHRRAA